MQEGGTQPNKEEEFPGDNSDAYMTGDEGEVPGSRNEMQAVEKKEIKEEKDFFDKKAPLDRVKLVRSFPKLPKLRSPEELPQFFVLCEALFLEDGFQLEELDRLGVKMELVSSFSNCPDVLHTATLQVTRPWHDFKRYLLNSFASPAKMRVEASRRLSKLEFDRDLIANRIRSLYEWFSIYETTTSTH